jgi:hypothetical protein
MLRLLAHSIYQNAKVSMKLCKFNNNNVMTSSQD